MNCRNDRINCCIVFMNIKPVEKQTYHKNSDCSCADSDMRNTKALLFYKILHGDEYKKLVPKTCPKQTKTVTCQALENQQVYM